MAARTSSGLLLWRRGDDGRVEVMLAHPGGPYFSRRDDGSWTVPKGEHEEDEDSLAAARREFAEEMGQPAPAGEPVALGSAAQSNGKVNHVWAIEADMDVTAVESNLFDLEWPPGSGRTQSFPEIDRAAWFDVEAARVKLFASQVPFVDRLVELVG